VSKVRDAGKGGNRDAHRNHHASQHVTEARAGDPRAFALMVRRHAPITRPMAVLWGAGADTDNVVGIFWDC